MFAILTIPVALSSCGGLGNVLGGSTSFQGTWSGTVTGNGNTGSMTLTIDSNNNVTGTDTISKAGNVTTYDSGSISTDGNLTLVTATAVTGGTNVANITAAVGVTSNTLSQNMTSSSGTIAVIGGNTTPFTLNLNTSSLGLVKHKG